MRPPLHFIDWTIIGLYVVFAIVVGAYFSRDAGKGVQSFFVGGRNMPWWLAGTSIVATTFAADTPLAVTGLVATGGISHNWVWWCWGIAHLTATFFFARMWRRSGVITDAEITELRYSGRAAALLRGIKAIYFGIFINCLTMAWVIAAMVKISTAFFDVEPVWVITACVGVSVAYTTLGGFRSVVVTDLVQFSMGMLGAIVLAIMVMSHFGGMGHVSSPGEEGAGLLGQLETTREAWGSAVGPLLELIPSANHEHVPLVYFVVLLFAGWWRYAEGNGYIVQRLAATKDEGHAQAASLWFSVAHNALRPWPWIIVALAALVVFPRGEAPKTIADPNGRVEITPGSLDVLDGGNLTVRLPDGESLRALMVHGESAAVTANEDGTWTASFARGFANSEQSAQVTVVDDHTTTVVDGLSVQLADPEIGYPLLMGQFLPIGLLGLVIASLLAAFMSTIDTHTNWGASYLVRDIYQRFINPQASERQSVRVSRGCIVFIAVLAGFTAIYVKSIASVWVFLITVGAGLGSVTAARWYWSRVSAQAELAAMATTTVVAISLQLFFTETLFGGPNPLFMDVTVPRWAQILVVAGASLATWIPVSLLGPKTDFARLQEFATLVRPPGPGWDGIRSGDADPLGPASVRFAAGCVVLFGTLLGLGELVVGSALIGLPLLGLAIGAQWWIVRSGR